MIRIARIILGLCLLFNFSIPANSLAPQTNIRKTANTQFGEMAQRVSFRAQDGVVVLPSLAGLMQGGIFDKFKNAQGLYDADKIISTQELNKIDFEKAREGVIRAHTGRRQRLLNFLYGLLPTQDEQEEKSGKRWLAKILKWAIKAIAERKTANAGYTANAMKVLADQGWVKRRKKSDREWDYQLTRKGISALSILQSSPTASGLLSNFQDFFSVNAYLYEFLGLSPPKRYLTNEEDYKNFDLFLEAMNSKWYLTDRGGLSKEDQAVHDYLLSQFNGQIIGPIMASLGFAKFFDNFFDERGKALSARKRTFKHSRSVSSQELQQTMHDQSKWQYVEKILQLFVKQGWLILEDGHYRLTPEGFAVQKISSSYGVTLSYSPSYFKIPVLLYGNVKKHIQYRDAEGNELMVNRLMNTWASGGAHETYFEKIDEIIKNIFYQQDIASQPRGIADMGSGDGTFLAHLMEEILKDSKRRSELKEYPLMFIGGDYNLEALKDAEKNVQAQKEKLRELYGDVVDSIHILFIHGDIRDPDKFDRDITAAAKQKFNIPISLEDVLSVRTFLDHNRPYEKPKKTQNLPPSTSMGVFVKDGELIPLDELEQNLREHMTHWAKYFKKHGALIMELHGLSEQDIMYRLGKTPGTAYTASHGYSDQLILELEVYNKILSSIGISIISQKHFPTSGPARMATISISHIMGSEAQLIPLALPVAA